MSLPRQYEASHAKGSLCSDFTPIRLAAWLAIVLILSKGFSLDRSRDYWWLLDLSILGDGPEKVLRITCYINYYIFATDVVYS